MSASKSKSLNSSAGDVRSALAPSGRRALIGGAAGQFIEFYDFALYGLLALTISETFFPNSDPALSLISTFATYGVAFLIRPLGGLFFGSLGDKVGRRTVLSVTLLLMGVSTTIMGSLPSYHSIGFFAPLLLLTCRLLQGFSAGGESAGAATFVFEHAPRGRRGLWMGITLGVTALPSVFGGGLLLLLSWLLDSQQFDIWGWRIPFWLSLPLAFFGLWVRLRTEESEEFLRTRADPKKRTVSPLAEAFRRDKLSMLQIIFIMGAAALNFYILSGYLVSYVQTAGRLSREQSLVINGLAMAVFALLLPTFGWLSDRVGRRPLLIFGAITVACAVFPVLMLASSGNVAAAITGQLIYVCASCLYGGGAYVYFVERFRTSNRFTASAISYNVGFALFGGAGPLVSSALIEMTGSALGPGILIACVSVVTLAVIIVTRAPETLVRQKNSSIGDMYD